MTRAITYDDLLRFARTIQGTHATAGRRARFDLAVDTAEIVVTPQSTGKARRVHRETVERVISRFNESASLSPGAYHDITYDSSYLLAIIGQLVQSELQGDDKLLK